MLIKIRTATLSGVEGYPVTVETDLRHGMPEFSVVGLADTTIRESCNDPLFSAKTSAEFPQIVTLGINDNDFVIFFSLQQCIKNLEKQSRLAAAG